MTNVDWIVLPKIWFNEENVHLWKWKKLIICNSFDKLSKFIRVLWNKMSRGRYLILKPNSSFSKKKKRMLGYLYNIFSVLNMCFLFCMIKLELGGNTVVCKINRGILLTFYVPWSLVNMRLYNWFGQHMSYGHLV